MDRTRFYRRLSPVLAAPMILAAAALPTVAQAAVPPLVARMLQTMAVAHSYRQTMVIVSTGSVADTSQSHMDLIAVRHGKALEEYIRLTQQSAKGAATTMEMVSGATHTCLRMSTVSPWNCSMGSMANLAASANVLSSAMLKQVSITPLGSKDVLGQSCDGYGFVTKLGHGLDSSGAVWIARVTGLPVEELGSSTTTIPIASGKSVTTKSSITVTWSQWNDPSLTIPSVPGA